MPIYKCAYQAALISAVIDNLAEDGRPVERVEIREDCTIIHLRPSALVPPVSTIQ